MFREESQHKHLFDFWCLSVVEVLGEIPLSGEGNVERTDKLLHGSRSNTLARAEEHARTDSRQVLQPHSRHLDWQRGSGQCLHALSVWAFCHCPKPEGKTHPVLLALLPIENTELKGRPHVFQLH